MLFRRAAAAVISSSSSSSSSLSRTTPGMWIRPLSSAAAKLSFSYPESLLHVPETKITTLPNGFRVASESHPSSETATIGVWIETGSRYETPHNNGVAHFLEHMTFKGTKKRTTSGLEVEVENMGGHLNAYTSRELTAFFAKVFAKDTAKAVDILADILQNAQLEESAIQRERGVILREMEEVAKQTQETVFDHLHAVAYQGSSLGMTILGPEKNIKSITKKDLEDYIAANYTAPRMVLAAAGGVQHEELVKLAEQAFGKLPSEYRGPQLTKARFVGGDVRIRDDDKEEAHIALAFEGVPWKSPDYFPLAVAQTIIGSWDITQSNGSNVSSKLAQRLAQDNLARGFSSFHTSYSDTGLFGVYVVGTNRGALDDLMYHVQGELVRICLSATESEVERAKNQLKTAILLLDGTTLVCEDIGRQLLIYGRRLSPYEIDARISAVDVKKVREVATKYLYDKDPAMAAFGPIEGLTDYNRIQTATSWLRY